MLRLKRYESGNLANLERYIKTYDNQEFVESQKRLFRKYDKKILLNIDFSSELRLFYQILKSADYTKVFSHKDFRFGNIFVTESDGIVVCDFDLFSYDDRGVDFGLMFYDFISFNPKIDFKYEEYMKSFIADYINECQRLVGKEYSDNPLNSVQQILNETKVYLLYVLLIISCLFQMNDPDKNEMPFLGLELTFNLVYFLLFSIN